MSANRENQELRRVLRMLWWIGCGGVLVSAFVVMMFPDPAVTAEQKSLALIAASTLLCATRPRNLNPWGGE